MSALEQEISLYNAQVLGLEGRQTKGWFRRFMKKVMIVLGADAMGAMLGASAGLPGGPVGTLIGGGAGAVSASAMAAVAVRNGYLDLNDDPFGYRKPYAIKLDSAKIQHLVVSFNPNCMKELVPRRTMVCFGNKNDSRVDSLGYLHNVSLIKVNNREPQWVNYSLQHISISATREFMKEARWGRYAIENIHYKTYPIVIRIADAANKSTDLEDFCKRMNYICPQMKGKTEVLSQAILGLGQVSEQELNSREYMEKLLDYVEKSNVNMKTKMELRIGIIVAHASSKLWDAAVFKNQ
ncbi:hypothetical protein EVA_04222 [gut metagenome]|uniref:Uncharacterized protein n=1 Tax=gut metagenome TaxID=749906 RepID=J9GK45_9ZZZZ